MPLDPNLTRPLHDDFGCRRVVEHILDWGQQVAQCYFPVSYFRTCRNL